MTRDTSCVALRMVPYRAFPNISYGRISRIRYLAFLEDYVALFLVVDGINSLEYFGKDTSTTSHREGIAPLATENAALNFMSRHPDPFAIDSKAL